MALNDLFTKKQQKVLQNNKALLSTTCPDGLHFELTYDGDKKKLYFDAYKLQENHEFTVE